MPLQVTVTPDITVDNNTVITADVLNRLGSPTVDVRGTLDGVSSQNIADGAVGNKQLAGMPANTVKGTGAAGSPRNLVLDSTLLAVNDPDSAKPEVGTLKVADGGITALQLANNSVGTSELTDLAVTLPKLAPMLPGLLLGNPSQTRFDPPEYIGLGKGLQFLPAEKLIKDPNNSRSRTGNVARIHTVAAHGLADGVVVNVTTSSTNNNGSTFIAYGVSISLVNVNEFTYPSVGPDELTPVLDPNMVVRQINQTKLVVSNIVLSATSFVNPPGPTYDPTGMPHWVKTAGDAKDGMLVYLSGPGTPWVRDITPQLSGSYLLVEVTIPVSRGGSSTDGWLALYRDPVETAGVSTPVAMAPFNILNSPGFGEARLSVVLPSNNNNQTFFKLKYSGVSIFFCSPPVAAAGSPPYYPAWPGWVQQTPPVSQLPVPQAIFRITELL